LARRLPPPARRLASASARELPPPARRLASASASAREFAVASCREFEAASGSEFEVTTAPCNNLPSPSIDEIVQTEYDQEKEQELVRNFEKVLQEQGSNESNTLLDLPSHDFDSNQFPEIQLCPESSSLAQVSELGWSQLAGTPSSPDTTQPGLFDDVNLAQLVAAEDPSRALVSNPGWPDLVGEALVCNNSSPGISNSSPGISNNSPGINNSSPGINNSSPGINNSSPGINNSCPELQVANRPITNVTKTRPSVIVSPRKRARFQNRN
jgi:hypothetical protein